ncbi:MAG TPA: TrbI/VirB10 family protein [Polyangia bacterium]|nr:TrbI/VirB10 family protein [Polyangia bacterium]
MSIKMAAAGMAAGLTHLQIAALATVGVVGLGGSGALVYHLVAKPAAPAAAPVSKEETKLAEKVDEHRARAAAEAKKLKQQDLGQGYQFDSQGNLLAASSEGSDLLQNRFGAAGAGGGRPAAVTAAIGRGIERNTRDDEYDDDLGGASERRAARRDDDDEAPEPEHNRAAIVAPMLGYSTVAGASWAARRPDNNGSIASPSKRTDGPQAKGDREQGIEKAAVALEESSRALEQTERGNGRDDASPGEAQPRTALAPMGTSGYWGPTVQVSHGPSVAGDSLYAEEKPAERAPQRFAAGTVGDMRIGGDVGPDVVVRQGKFLDCVVVNEIRADLVDSPVIAMVSRDFISLDGKFVLLPAGAKLLGEAGRVQNLQQERVYIKFDRVLFPDQRSAYFPTRKVPAVDHMGAVGVAGDVDRHFMLQFGAAVMLGILDGLGAAVQSPSAGTNPTLRDLMMARTSADLGVVMGGVIQKYANVVPTVTVDAGSKMKVFFAEDVRLSPYASTSDLAWVGAGR